MSAQDSSGDEPSPEEQSNKRARQTEEDWKDDDFLSLHVDDSNNSDDDNSGDDASSASSSLFHDHDDNNNDNGSLLPPWMTRHVDIIRGTHPLIALHNEIVGFARLLEPTKAEIAEREELIGELQRLVDKAFNNNGTVVEMQVFGSQCTNLFLPSSDIDIVLTAVAKDNKAAGDNNNKQKNGNGNKTNDIDDDVEMTDELIMDKFANALRDYWLADLSYFEVLSSARVPLVKFTHAPSNISVDVSFGQPGGPQAASLLRTFLQAMPPLRPLTFVLKHFLAARDLNKPFTGGIGSYMLQLMIVSFLQHREREFYNQNRSCWPNLGAMLLEFFELYGLNFNYYITGISVRYDGFYFVKGAPEYRDSFCHPTKPTNLAIENPLDQTMDVGKSSFRMPTLHRTWAYAYHRLLAHIAAPVQPTVSILESILPVTDEMRQRAKEKQQRRTDIRQRSILKQSDGNNKSKGNYGPLRKKQRR